MAIIVVILYCVRVHLNIALAAHQTCAMCAVVDCNHEMFSDVYKYGDVRFIVQKDTQP